MLKNGQTPELVELPGMSAEEALRLYAEGVRRLRKPTPMLAGNGLDTNSYDFRGVRAAMDVVRTFPHTTDGDGNRLLVDPQGIKTYMDLGLSAIAASGRRPLAEDFVMGYQRMAEAFTRSPEEPASPLGQAAF